MPYEINPLNPLNAATGLYSAFMHELFILYEMALFTINQALDLSNYSQPFSQNVGKNESLRFNLKKEVTITLHFERVKIRTFDGLFTKSRKEETRINFKRTSYANKPRIDPTGLFGRINIELSDEVLLIERYYPNLIDLISNIGGILKILVFLCVATGMIHNQVLFDKYLLEAIFRPEKHQDGQSGPQEENSKTFSYKEVFMLNYCCRNKSNSRKEEFDRKQEILAQRMDIGNIVKGINSSGMLTGAVLQPYQVAILSLYKQQNDLTFKKQSSLALKAAQESLTASLDND